MGKKKLVSGVHDFLTAKVPDVQLDTLLKAQLYLPLRDLDPLRFSYSFPIQRYGPTPSSHRLHSSIGIACIGVAGHFKIISFDYASGICILSASWGG